MAEYDQEAPHGTSVGERLRAAREARALTLDDVASQTRIPIRHLRHIEDGQWDELPAVTYTVGFARNYANAVGLDGAAIGRELRDQIGGVDRASQLSPDIYAQSDPARAPSRPLAWIAGILVVVMIAGYLIWRGQLRDDDATAKAPAAASETAEAPVATQPQQPAAPASVTGQPVTLVAAADVWMSVTDRGANNRRLYYNTLRQGERFQVPADSVRPVIFTTNPQNLRVSIGSQDRGLLAAQRGRMNDQSLKAEDLATLPSLAGQQPAVPSPG
jgi:cytoskeleton protein RodZ